MPALSYMQINHPLTLPPYRPTGVDEVAWVYLELIYREGRTLYEVSRTHKITNERIHRLLRTGRDQLRAIAQVGAAKRHVVEGTVFLQGYTTDKDPTMTVRDWAGDREAIANLLKYLSGRRARMTIEVLE